MKVLERLGMRFERQGQLQGLDALFYTLDAVALKLQTDGRLEGDRSER